MHYSPYSPLQLNLLCPLPPYPPTPPPHYNMAFQWLVPLLCTALLPGLKHYYLVNINLSFSFNSDVIFTGGSVSPLGCLLTFLSAPAWWSVQDCIA